MRPSGPICLPRMEQSEAMGFPECRWMWDPAGASPAEPFPTLQPWGQPLTGIRAMVVSS